MGAFPQPAARSISSSCLPGEIPPITHRSLSVSHNERLRVECFTTLPSLIAEAGVVPQADVWGLFCLKEVGNLVKMISQNKVRRNALRDRG